ncbi:GTA-gp10 family protein [Asticcacaulis sp. EMRT-3]|uniref:GTA-gp10 family protein n=1 Tax=Asticcacaulis sp. EMRT-3 TaxID=3040349 RepID=UPI0024AEC118|nr:GTA-gp10 family protein [Asticcacaulis sp. EMRT-3]MDI7775381.1 GTA-gp10 family protein [Asticcacaulis sp. EMRT-3]
MLLCNPARGEVMATLGGREVRLCVSLGGLAALESHFGVSGFEALAERLKHLGAGDLLSVLRALCVEDLDGLEIGLNEAMRAVVLAFAAMNP